LISKLTGLVLGSESDRTCCRRFKNFLNTAKDERGKDGEAIVFARASVSSGKSWFLNVGSASGSQGGALVLPFEPSGDTEFIVNQMADRGLEYASAAGWGASPCSVDNWDIGPGDVYLSALSRNFSAECCKSVFDINSWKSFRRRNWVSS